MPGFLFWAYAQMLGRLQAERVKELANLALATGGRELSDSDRREFYAGLDDAIAGGGRQKRGTPITAAQAKWMGLRLAPPPKPAG